MNWINQQIYVYFIWVANYTKFKSVNNTSAWRDMEWFTVWALAFANRHWIKRLWSKRNWWTTSVVEKDFLVLKRSKPMLRIFSTLLCGGFKLENDNGLSLLSKDKGGDPDLPGDSAHWDLELMYPISELAFFTAFCVIYFFIIHESSKDKGSESEASPLLPHAAMYLEETSLPNFLELSVLCRGTESKLVFSDSESIEFLAQRKFPLKVFSSRECLAGSR